MRPPPVAEVDGAGGLYECPNGCESQCCKRGMERHHGGGGFGDRLERECVQPGGRTDNAIGPAKAGGLLCENIQAASANINTVTVQFDVAAAFPDTRSLEFSGIAANPVDVTAAATGTTPPPAGGRDDDERQRPHLWANMVSTLTVERGLDSQA
jgi:hypothetical protein